MIEEMYTLYCNSLYEYIKDRVNAHVYVGIRNNKLGIHIEEGDIGLIFTMDDMLRKITLGEYPTKILAKMIVGKWREAIYGWYFKSEKAV